MILEAGRIVAVEPDVLWVETIQRSTCNTCRAEQGCGQSMMAKLSGHTSYLRVLLQGRDSSDYQLGDEVQIGVPEAVVANGSLFVYLLPLLSMLLFSGFAHWQLGQEPLTIFAALVGLVAGGLVVRWRAYQTRNDSHLQPVLVDDRELLKLLS
jgi:sigma-E factor negative regulatory protein RseC